MLGQNKSLKQNLAVLHSFVGTGPISTDIDKKHDNNYIAIARLIHVKRQMMTVQQQAFPTLDLTVDEISNLPAALREKIKVALGDQIKEPKRWVLVGAETAEQATIMRKTVKAVGQITQQRRAALSAGNIEKLVDLYLEGEKRAEIDEEIELDNARLRAKYLSETKSYTAAKIRSLSLKAKPKNKSEPASRWKREKKIFAIRHRGSDFFPCFQFADGSPLPVIKTVLTQLPDDMTPWQIAFWFASGNGWLDGKAPQEALSDVKSVLGAADRMRETAIG